MTRKKSDPLGIRYIGCDAGWIFIHIAALMPPDQHLAATHIDDPFFRMIEWLEEICDGAKVAMWQFSQEGITARLIFAEASDGFMGGGDDRIILIDDSNCYEHVASARVNRSTLVAEFYQSFRQFLKDGYQPEQWEFGLPLHLSYHDLTEEDEEYYRSRGLLCWDGFMLREVRSRKIEAFLTDNKGVQLSMDFLNHK